MLRFYLRQRSWLAGLYTFMFGGIVFFQQVWWGGASTAIGSHPSIWRRTAVGTRLLCPTRMAGISPDRTPR